MTQSAWQEERFSSSHLPTLARLLPLPLAALRLDADTVDALVQVGLKRIADVLDRPRAPLAARFGEAFVRRIDQALGREDEPITPRLPIPALCAEHRFPEPIALESDVLGTIENLAQELGRAAGAARRRRAAVALALFRTDGKVFRLEVGTGAPLREGARIRAPVRGAARRDRRCMRSGLRLRRDPPRARS